MNWVMHMGNNFFRKVDYLLPLFTLAAFLGNMFNIPLFFGVDLLFGSIFTIIILLRYGVRWSIIATLIAAFPTIYLWGHPYASMIFLMEIIFLGIALRKFRQIIFIDVTFWFFIGMPLVYFFYNVILDLSITATVLIMLKQTFNGVLNAGLANLLLLVIYLITNSKNKTFAEIIFTLFTSIILLLGLAFLVASGQKDYRHIEENISMKIKVVEQMILHQWSSSTEISEQLILDHINGDHTYVLSTDEKVSWLDEGFIVQSTIDDIYHWYPNTELPKMSLWAKSKYFTTIQIDQKDIVIFKELSGSVNRLYQMYIENLLVTLTLFLIYLMVAWRVSQAIVKPLKLLTEKTKDLPVKILSGERIPWDRSKLAYMEIDQLFLNFKEMADELTTKFSRQERKVTGQTLQLQKANKHLTEMRYALDESSIVAITNAEGVITYVNAKFCHISKYSKEELIGYTHSKVNSNYHPPEFFIEMWKTIKAGQIWKGKIKNKAKDGSFYWVDTTITPFLNDQNIPYQYIAIRHDVTEQMRIDELKDELISTVTHELKTPLSVILGFAERLIIVKEEIKREKYLTIIQKETKRLSDLITKFLDIQQLEAGKLVLNKKNYDLIKLINNAIELWTLNSHKIIFSTDISKANVLVDENKILQVLHNLLINAIKFSPKKDTVLVRLKQLQDEYVVEIEDFGIGIPEEVNEKIFSHFFRVDNSASRSIGGTGLGLALSKRIMEAHYGQINYVSKIGTGTTFFIHFPKEGIGELTSNRVVGGD